MCGEAPRELPLVRGQAPPALSLGPSQSHSSLPFPVSPPATATEAGAQVNRTHSPCQQNLFIQHPWTCSLPPGCPLLTRRHQAGPQCPAHTRQRWAALGPRGSLSPGPSSGQLVLAAAGSPWLAPLYCPAEAMSQHLRFVLVGQPLPTPVRGWHSQPLLCPGSAP